MRNFKKLMLDIPYSSRYPNIFYIIKNYDIKNDEIFDYYYCNADFIEYPEGYSNFTKKKKTYINNINEEEIPLMLEFIEFLKNKFNYQKGYEIFKKYYI